MANAAHHQRMPCCSFRSPPPHHIVSLNGCAHCASCERTKEGIAGRLSVRTGECSTQQCTGTLLPLLLRTFRHEIYFISIDGSAAPSHQHQQYATSMQFPFARREACELWATIYAASASAYSFNVSFLRIFVAHKFFRISLCANRFCRSTVRYDMIPLP